MLSNGERHKAFMIDFPLRGVRALIAAHAHGFFVRALKAVG